MDIPKMIELWKGVIVTLCTAHEKAEVDKAEYKLDDLLSPILTAPVAQLREFYAELTKALREDQRVPFFMWSMFNVWGKAVIDRTQDKEGVKRLKKKLAGEISDMVEKDIKADLPKALVGALMWRNPDTLEEIKADLEAGAKPKLKGRESCLFLVTKRRGKNAVEHQVML